MVSERETVVELPWAADCCPCVVEAATVLPSTVGIRDRAVQLGLTHQRGASGVDSPGRTRALGVISG